MTALTVSQAAKRFGLSRSTLLYYDSIGLLTPSARSPAGYRLYSDADLERLAAIRVYREAGIPLEDVGEILESGGGRLRRRLDERLTEINREIARLRYQQQVIVGLLHNDEALARTRVMTKKRWVALLRASGLDDAGMERWHREFEALSPEAHQDFLESLGIDAREIDEIRCWSRGDQMFEADKGKTG